MQPDSPAWFLIEHKSALAEEVTSRLYDDMPDLVERYGERGREKTLQDMHYNIEHLAPAVDLSEPQMFANYIKWLDNLLRSRNVPTDITLRCFEITRDVLHERLNENQMSKVAPVLEAGLAVLAADGS